MAITVTQSEFIRTTRGVRSTVLGAAVALALTVMAPEDSVGADNVRQIPFPEVRLIIEFNASAEDVGVQFFLDSDGWKTVKIFDPRGRQIFEATAAGRLLRQGGGTELFVESVEPPLDELPLEDFFHTFTEGTYRFTGRTPEGDKLVGAAEFSHDIPAGPVVITPTAAVDECAENVPLPVTIAWNEVTSSIVGEPLEIVKYQVLAGDDLGDFLDVFTTGTSLTIPDGLLSEGTSYIFEILAIEEGGNQTITEGCFVTAN